MAGCSNESETAVDSAAASDRPRPSRCRHATAEESLEGKSLPGMVAGEGSEPPIAISHWSWHGKLCLFLAFRTYV